MTLCLSKEAFLQNRLKRNGIILTEAPREPSFPLPQGEACPEPCRRSQSKTGVRGDQTPCPPQEGLPTSIPGTAAFVELPPSNELYALITDKPVVVLQFMVGESWDSEPADPSLLATLPTARFAPSGPC